jgi:hypothetical protein
MFAVAHPDLETKRRVAELLDEGLNHTQIARALGVAKHTVSYHARKRRPSRSSSWSSWSPARAGI